MSMPPLFHKNCSPKGNKWPLTMDQPTVPPQIHRSIRQLCFVLFMAFSVLCWPHFFFFFLSFCLFRVIPMAYGGSQARGPIGAVATTYTTVTAMPDPSHVCDLHHSPRQHQILNPLSEARDQTRNLMIPSRIRFCCAMTGTPEPTF